ncbi:MAG: type II methionyl aminopeptidase [Candidatus Micrarchaeaceae archaeon]
MEEGKEEESVLNEDEIKTIEEVGALSFKAISKAKEMAKPGMKLVDLAESVEKFVRENGFGIAFPINLSANIEAAHYTPSLMDDRVIGEKDIMKIDFGAAKDGLLGDCALTLDFSGENQDLIQASKDALDNAVSMVKAGAKVRDIGKEIERTIKSMGFNPVMNLGGHGVGRHNLHADLFIPNYDNGSDDELEEGKVIAIEPFATTGKGMITEGDTCEIYSFNGEAGVRSQGARQLMAEISNKYPSEPFAVRWLSNIIPSRFGLYAAIQELARSGAIEPYPTLIEVSKGMVSQAEVSMLVERDGCRVLTK